MAKDTNDVRLPRGAVRDLICTLLAKTRKVKDHDEPRGYTCAAVAEKVRTKYPTARTSRGSVACYVTYARKQSHGVTGDRAAAILAVTARA